MHVRIGAPEGYAARPRRWSTRRREIAAGTGGSVPLDAPTRSPRVAGADVVVTDTWVSMGKEDEAAASAWRPSAPYAAHRRRCSPTPTPDAIVLHCLPAYRGKEIDAEVIDGPRSVVWDEAENRRHAQKAVLTWLLDGLP